MDLGNLREWVGRAEERVDQVSATPLAALSATLDNNDPEPRPGAQIPPLWHWLYFTPLRKNGPQWSQVVIWLSGVGTFAAMLVSRGGSAFIRLARVSSVAAPTKGVRPETIS